jgi:cytidylate kinase
LTATFIAEAHPAVAMNYKAFAVRYLCSAKRRGITNALNYNNRYAFKVDLDTASLYDLIINMGKMTKVTLDSFFYIVRRRSYYATFIRQSEKVARPDKW